jgi:Na+/melibiose symporter-like transporter
VILLTWGRVAALVAGAIIAGLGMPLIESMGWTPMALTLALVAMIFMTPIRFFAIERVNRIDQTNPSPRETLHYLRSHRPMIVLYLALLAAFSTNTALVATNYFAIYNLGGGETSFVAPLLLSQLAPMFVLVFMLPWLIRRFGKRQIYIWGSLFGAVFGLLQYVIGYENTTLVIILNMFKSTGMFLPLLLLGMFSADFVEYGQHHQGRRLEGIAFSIQTFATKFTQAVAVGVGGLLLSFYGYVPNVAQSQATLDGIFALYTLFPTFGALASAWIMYQFYNLHEADVETMIDVRYQ